MPFPSVTWSSISSRTPALSARWMASASISTPGGCSAWSAKADAARASPRAILRRIDRRGRIASGRVLLDPGSPEQQELSALDPEGRAMRKVRGGRIGLIFQEPMTALSVHYTVGNQIIEAIRAHSDLSKSAARERVVGLLHEVGIPRPEAA